MPSAQGEMRPDTVRDQQEIVAVAFLFLGRVVDMGCGGYHGFHGRAVRQDRRRVRQF